MATPNTLRTLIGNKTPYQWLNEQLKIHQTIKEVAAQNKVTTSAIYKLIADEELVIVQRVFKTIAKLDA